MFNFFAIVLIIFIGILLLVFKKRSFKNLMNKGKLDSIKLKNHRKNNINLFLIKKVFYTNTKKKSTQHFIKSLKAIKCLVFFKELQKTN